MKLVINGLICLLLTIIDKKSVVYRFHLVAKRDRLVKQSAGGCELKFSV